MARRTNIARSILVLALGSAASLGCNAILGADEYKVGEGEDGSGASSGDTGGTGNDTGGTTGSGGKGTGASATAGGSNPGTGGRSGTGGATPPGSGGKGTGGATSGGVTAFIGSWITDTELTTTSCSDGMPPMTETVSDQLDWEEGATAGTIQTTLPVADCTLVATVSGKVATLPKTMCTDPTGILVTISGSFTIQSDGTARLVETITLSMDGFSCTADASGTFTKLAAL